MNIGSHYKLKVFLLWTRKNIYWLFVLSFVPTFLYQVMEWKWLAIPWVPITLVGTAAAFIAGFKNTLTYNRMWEARSIWGAIVNSSRTFAIMVRDFIHCTDSVEEKNIHREMINRHIAWLTALRFNSENPEAGKM
ncbi:hypothetical protein [Pedobacter sp. NJ-S-72]